ncbi:MAG: hypothetical protein A2177_14340 [Spirochaetes bacterium RBG_13_68_11]|nr:MAG: hypothetical protein A2177_14340 [Spirochaetes bacterium RBG_13_68_11]
MRLAGLKVVSGDMQWWVMPWYDFIASNDWAAALRGEYSNCTPPYLYLLTVAAKTNVLLPKVVAIKLISILFDCVNAYLVYRILKGRVANGNLAMLAAGLFLCLPTVAANSATWGQADAIYACFVLASVFLLLQRHPARAMLVFGIAAAAVMTLAWVVVYARRIRNMTADITILCATVSVAIVPFLLPKMHDRFFYLLDVFSFLLVFFMPRLWIVAVAAQVASVLVYLMFLVVPASASLHSMGGIVMGVAVLSNSFAVCFLLWQQWTVITKANREIRP